MERRFMRNGGFWLLGFAVLVSYSTMASVFGHTLPGSVAPSSGAQLAARVLQAAVCLAVAFAAMRGASPGRERVLQFASVLACCVAVPLPALAGALADGAAPLARILADVAPWLRSCGYVFLWLAWIELFARLDLAHMLVSYLLLHVVSAALSFVLGNLPLPAAAVGAVVCAMPWVAWAMFSRAGRLVETAPYACGETEAHPWAFPFVPVVLMAAFTSTNHFVRGMLPGTMTIYATAGVVAACLTAIVVVRRRGVGSFDVWHLAGVAFVLTLAGLLATHVTGGGWAIAASLATNAGFALFNVFLCAVLCNISYRYGVNSMVLFGFAKAADCLAYLLGAALLDVVGSVDGSGNAFALVVGGLAVFLAVSFVLLVDRRGENPSWGLGLVSRRPVASSREAEGGHGLAGEGGVTVYAPDAGPGSDGMSGSGEADGLLVSASQLRALEDACAALAREHGLTRREEEVLALLARDLPASDIERELCVSNATAKTHTQACYRKLGVHSRREIVDLTAQTVRSRNGAAAK